jgi:hypothetical protein
MAEGGKHEMKRPVCVCMSVGTFKFMERQREENVRARGQCVCVRVCVGTSEFMERQREETMRA